MRFRTLSALAAALTALIPGGIAHAGPFDTGSSGTQQHETSNCFWFGPTFSATNQQLNYAFPDSGALYWAAQFDIPEGATLSLKGQYAHARYQSLNSYDVTTNSPTAAVNDVSTVPDSGSHNPYLPGANRLGETGRDYTVRVLDSTAPAEPQPNTLYAGVPGQQRTTLIYRLYLPDNGRDITGGVGLPRPELHTADGQLLTGEQLCQAVQAVSTTPRVDVVPGDTYQALRNQPGKPDTFPADNPTVWRTFYNQPFGLTCIYLGQCDGAPARTGGQYSNIDNNYVNAYVSRKFGEVLTLTGTMPRTPRTLDGQPMLDGGVDMRYWSLCSNESVATTRVAGCVYDEQVPLDAARHYTIVASLPSQRPANAIPACGVAWVPLPENGDGAGHADDAYLILRNMLPSDGFGHAVQDTHAPGDEKSVMGEFLPEATYSSKAQFEAGGCHPLR
ncbi:hypothetical protein [Nocardia cyriacigeorgica]|uniref:hypothetical protein n=1 Tax=Nocardia cyriacigeorgica TaxID=135487 RepID=UPI00245665DD|nr:hypothetical protein [Nocardia cyriacigeorgica]